MSSMVETEYRRRIDLFPDEAMPTILRLWRLEISQPLVGSEFVWTEASLPRKHELERRLLKMKATAFGIQMP